MMLNTKNDYLTQTLTFLSLYLCKLMAWIFLTMNPVRINTQSMAISKVYIVYSIHQVAKILINVKCT